MPDDATLGKGADMEMTTDLGGSGIIEAEAAIALLGVDIAEGGLPVATGEADGMPNDAFPANAADVQIATYACTIHILEAQAAIALLGVDIAERGLPVASGEADGVPDDA